MLRLTRMAALVCCDREIGGMADRQERADFVDKVCGSARTDMVSISGWANPIRPASALLRTGRMAALSVTVRRWRSGETRRRPVTLKPERNAKAGT
jgi:hypothetical protein